MKTRALASLVIVSRLNYIFSIAYLLLVGIATVAGSELFFEDNSNMYGPMAGNIKLMLLFTGIMAFAVYAISHLGDSVLSVLLLGMFFLMMAPGLEIYAQINEVSVDDNYRWLYGYCGASHIAYAISGTSKDKEVRST